MRGSMTAPQKTSFLDTLFSSPEGAAAVAAAAAAACTRAAAARTAQRSKTQQQKDGFFSATEKQSQQQEGTAEWPADSRRGPQADAGDVAAAAAAVAARDGAAVAGGVVGQAQQVLSFLTMQQAHRKEELRSLISKRLLSFLHSTEYLSRMSAAADALRLHTEAMQTTLQQLHGLYVHPSEPPQKEPVGLPSAEALGTWQDAQQQQDDDDKKEEEEEEGVVLQQQERRGVQKYMQRPLALVSSAADGEGQQRWQTFFAFPLLSTASARTAACAAPVPAAPFDEGGSLACDAAPLFFSEDLPLLQATPLDTWTGVATDRRARSTGSVRLHQQLLEQQQQQWPSQEQQQQQNSGEQLAADGASLLRRQNFRCPPFPTIAASEFLSVPVLTPEVATPCAPGPAAARAAAAATAVCLVGTTGKETAVLQGLQELLLLSSTFWKEIQRTCFLAALRLLLIDAPRQQHLLSLLLSRQRPPVAAARAVAAGRAGGTAPSAASHSSTQAREKGKEEKGQQQRQQRRQPQEAAREAGRAEFTGGVVSRRDCIAIASHAEEETAALLGLLQTYSLQCLSAPLLSCSAAVHAAAAVLLLQVQRLEAGHLQAEARAGAVAGANTGGGEEEAAATGREKVEEEDHSASVADRRGAATEAAVSAAPGDDTTAEGSQHAASSIAGTGTAAAAAAARAAEAAAAAGAGGCAAGMADVAAEAAVAGAEEEAAAGTTALGKWLLESYFGCREAALRRLLEGSSGGRTAAHAPADVERWPQHVPAAGSSERPDSAVFSAAATAFSELRRPHLCPGCRQRRERVGRSAGGRSAGGRTAGGVAAAAAAADAGRTGAATAEVQEGSETDRKCVCARVVRLLYAFEASIAAAWTVCSRVKKQQQLPASPAAAVDGGLQHQQQTFAYVVAPAQAAEVPLAQLPAVAQGASRLCRTEGEVAAAAAGTATPVLHSKWVTEAVARGAELPSSAVAAAGSREEEKAGGGERLQCADAAGEAALPDATREATAPPTAAVTRGEATTSSAEAGSDEAGGLGQFPAKADEEEAKFLLPTVASMWLLGGVSPGRSISHPATAAAGQMRASAPHGGRNKSTSSGGEGRKTRQKQRSLSLGAAGDRTKAEETDEAASGLHSGHFGAVAKVLQQQQWKRRQKEQQEVLQGRALQQQRKFLQQQREDVDRLLQLAEMALLSLVLRRRRRGKKRSQRPVDGAACSSTSHSEDVWSTQRKGEEEEQEEAEEKQARPTEEAGDDEGARTFAGQTKRTLDDEEEKSILQRRCEAYWEVWFPLVLQGIDQLLDAQRRSGVLCSCYDVYCLWIEITRRLSGLRCAARFVKEALPLLLLQPSTDETSASSKRGVRQEDEQQQQDMHQLLRTSLLTSATDAEVDTIVKPLHFYWTCKPRFCCSSSVRGHLVPFATDRNAASAAESATVAAFCAAAAAPLASPPATATAPVGAAAAARQAAPAVHPCRPQSVELQEQQQRPQQQQRHGDQQQEGLENINEPLVFFIPRLAIKQLLQRTCLRLLQQQVRQQRRMLWAAEAPCPALPSAGVEGSTHFFSASTRSSDEERGSEDGEGQCPAEQLHAWNRRFEKQFFSLVRDLVYVHLEEEEVAAAAKTGWSAAQDAWTGPWKGGVRFLLGLLVQQLRSELQQDVWGAELQDSQQQAVDLQPSSISVLPAFCCLTFPGGGANAAAGASLPLSSVGLLALRPALLWACKGCSLELLLRTKRKQQQQQAGGVAAAGGQRQRQQETEERRGGGAVAAAEGYSALTAAAVEDEDFAAFLQACVRSEQSPPVISSSSSSTAAAGSPHAVAKQEPQLAQLVGPQQQPTGKNTQQQQQQQPREEELREPHPQLPTGHDGGLPQTSSALSCSQDATAETSLPPALQLQQLLKVGCTACYSACGAVLWNRFSLLVLDVYSQQQARLSSRCRGKNLQANMRLPTEASAAAMQLLLELRQQARLLLAYVGESSPTASLLLHVLKAAAAAAIAGCFRRIAAQCFNEAKTAATAAAATGAAPTASPVPPPRAAAAVEAAAAMTRRGCEGGGGQAALALAAEAMIVDRSGVLLACEAAAADVEGGVARQNDSTAMNRSKTDSIGLLFNGQNSSPDLSAAFVGTSSAAAADAPAGAGQTCTAAAAADFPTAAPVDDASTVAAAGGTAAVTHGNGPGQQFSFYNDEQQPKGDYVGSEEYLSLVFDACVLTLVLDSEPPRWALNTFPKPPEQHQAEQRQQQCCVRQKEQQHGLSSQVQQKQQEQPQQEEKQHPEMRGVDVTSCVGKGGAPETEPAATAATAASTVRAAGGETAADVGAGYTTEDVCVNSSPLSRHRAGLLWEQISTLANSNAVLKTFVREATALLAADLFLQDADRTQRVEELQQRQQKQQPQQPAAVAQPVEKEEQYEREQQQQQQQQKGRQRLQAQQQDNAEQLKRSSQVQQQEQLEKDAKDLPGGREENDRGRQPKQMQQQGHHASEQREHEGFINVAGDARVKDGEVRPRTTTAAAVHAAVQQRETSAAPCEGSAAARLWRNGEAFLASCRTLLFPLSPVGEGVSVALVQPDSTNNSSSSTSGSRSSNSSSLRYGALRFEPSPMQLLPPMERIQLLPTPCLVNQQPHARAQTAVSSTTAGAGGGRGEERLSDDAAAASAGAAPLLAEIKTGANKQAQQEQQQQDSLWSTVIGGAAGENACKNFAATASRSLQTWLGRPAAGWSLERSGDSEQAPPSAMTKVASVSGGSSAAANLFRFVSSSPPPQQKLRAAPTAAAERASVVDCTVSLDSSKPACDSSCGSSSTSSSRAAASSRVSSNVEVLTRHMEQVGSFFGRHTEQVQSRVSSVFRKGITRKGDSSTSSSSLFFLSESSNTSQQEQERQNISRHRLGVSTETKGDHF